MDLIVKRGVDTVSGQDRKADLLQRGAEAFREARFVFRVTVQKRAQIQRGDPGVVVELVAFVFGQTIGMRLAHLIVLCEFLAQGIWIGHVGSLALRPLSSKRYQLRHGRPGQARP